MILLFDYDSFIYTSVYRIVSFTEIRELFEMGLTKEQIAQHIIDKSIDRLDQSTFNLFESIEETGIEISSVEYYITACKDSERKRLFPDYKANRSKRKNPMTKWVSKLRAELVSKEFAITDDKWEADDLIADRAAELDGKDFIVVSMDKDMKQLGGLFFDYYKVRSKNVDGSYEDHGYRGLSSISKAEANYYFWEQMLLGDKADNISGVKGIGEVKCSQILATSEDYENDVKSLYIEKSPNGIDDYYKNYFLIKLGTNRDNLLTV